MRNYRTVAIVLILVGLLSVPAQAQVIPGRWEKIEALGVGPPIIVDLKSGDRLEGKFAALSPSELSLRNGSAQAAIPRADIRRITTREPDPLTNGILIGAGIGGGIAGAIGPLSNDWHPGSRVLMALMGAGIGAAIGVVATLSRRRTSCFIKRPDPPIPFPMGPGRLYERMKDTNVLEEA